MKTYHIQSSITATTDNVGSVQILRDCFLLLIQWRLMLTNATLANADYIYGQIGVVPLFQSSTDAPGILAVYGTGVGFTTSGAAVQNQIGVVPMRYPLKAGEKLSHSVIESGANTWNMAIVFHTSA